MAKIYIITALTIIISITANAQMMQTPHNLSANASDSNEELCKYCHTPHAKLAHFDAPLWDKSIEETEFSLYGDDVTDTSDTSNPHKYSMICLSCHDGVNSINTVVKNDYNLNNIGSGKNSIIERSSRSRSININEEEYSGNDDHPVSIVYVPGNASLKPISTPLKGEWKGATIISDLLRDGKVECGSCHDPHYLDQDGIFLRNSNGRSQLCLSCHDK